MAALFFYKEFEHRSTAMQRSRMRSQEGVRSSQIVDGEAIRHLTAGSRLTSGDRSAPMRLQRWVE
jgi:hypothetical protein